MAGSGVSAGHETRVHYYWEDGGFASAPNDTTPKTVGANAQLNSQEGENNVRRVFAPGQRYAVDQVALNFEGSFSLQFTLTNPWWMRTLIGSPTQNDNAEGSYTYTYDGTSPETIQIVEGFEQTDKQRVLKGCMVTQASVSVSVEDEVQVTIRGAYAEEEQKTNALTPQETPSYDPLTFAEGSVSVDGSTESYIQSADLTLRSQIDPILEIGSRFPIDFNPKVLEPDLDLEQIFDGDHTTMEEFYGGTGETSVQEDADDNAVEVTLSFDNGQAAGSGINKGTFTLTGSLKTSYDISGSGDPRADLQEAVNEQARKPELTWTNEESTEP